jgi:hypothetical protein
LGLLTNLARLLLSSFMPEQRCLDWVDPPFHNLLENAMSKHEPQCALPCKTPERPLPANTELTEGELSQVNAGGASAGIILINRRRWGDLENRVSYGDLVRW